MFLALVAGLVFASCDDDDDYSPATAESGPQVYFHNEVETDIEIDPSASSVSIQLLRANTDGDITVPLTVEGDEGTIYNVPTSVTFDDGESTTDLVISYDPDDISYGVYDEITITIDDDYDTAYGFNTITITIGVTAWGDWDYWNSDGTCDYIYSIFFSGTDAGLEFLYRHNFITTNLYQFKVCNCMYGVDLVLDYDSDTGIVAVSEPTSTDYYYDYYEEYVYLCDYNYYWGTLRGYTIDEDFSAAYGYFDTETGTIAIPVVYYISLGYFGYDYEYIYIGGYDNPDVTIDVAYGGKIIDGNDAISAVIATVTLGEDVEYANVGIVEGSLTQDGLDAVIDGTCTLFETVTASGDVKFDASELVNGTDYTIVAVSFYGDEAQEYATASFTFSTSGAETWTAIAVGDYEYYYFFEGTDPDLTLYQSDDDETRYKIEHWGYDVDFKFTYDESTGEVVVDDQEIGYEYGSYGMVCVMDLVDYVGSTAYGESYYSDGVFYFNVIYYVSAGYFGYGYETFTITSTTRADASMESAPAVAKDAPALKSNAAMKPGKKLETALQPMLRLR